MSRMIDVPINNEELIETLDKFLWFYKEREKIDKYIRVTCEEDVGQKERWTTEKHLNEIMDQAEGHEGFPDYLVAYQLDAEKIIHQVRDFQQQGDVIETKQKSWLAEATKNYSEWNSEIIEILCVRNNALAVLYPPGGYISWHNNANASAYNFIFTWSETGEGCFKYVDGMTGETVIVQDKPGWQCKAGYFGAYGEPMENLVYHSASTDCWRMTISFMLDRTDLSLDMQEDVIAEIKAEY